MWVAEQVPTKASDGIEKCERKVRGWDADCAIAEGRDGRSG